VNDRVLRQGRYTCIRNGTRETNFPQRHFFPALRGLRDGDAAEADELALTAFDRFL